MDSIFINLKSEYKTDEQNVPLNAICNMWHSKQGDITVNAPIVFKGKTRVITAYSVMKVLTEKFPGCDIQNLGPSEIVLNRPAKINSMSILKAIGLCLILFFGGALGIMAFNEDVSMRDTLDSIHTYYTGETDNIAPYISIPFAIGVSAGFLGILQIFKKKESPPGILDLTLDEYETQLDDYHIKRQV